MFLLVNSHQADQSRRSFYLISHKFKDQWHKKHEKGQKFVLDKSFLDWPMVQWYTTLQNLFVSLDEFKILYQNKKTIIASYVIYKLQV